MKKNGMTPYYVCMQPLLYILLLLIPGASCDVTRICVLVCFLFPFPLVINGDAIAAIDNECCTAHAAVDHECCTAHAAQLMLHS